jgi:hypothetical protein
MTNCDHIVGIIDGFENEPCNLVFVSDKDNEFAWYAKYLKSQGDNQYTPINFFRFCPVCGKQINKVSDYDNFQLL